jgi:integrase
MTTPTRTRRRIQRGVYRDEYGLAAVVKVNGVQREQRFPPDTSIKSITNWRAETKAALRKLHPSAARGSFAADAEKYLQAVATLKTIKEREYLIGLWTAEFGQRPRHSIKTYEISAVLKRWEAEGLAPSTVRNRRIALLSMFTTLDGEGTGIPNPVVDAYLPDLPEEEARNISYETIENIFAAMPDRGQGIRGKARDTASKTKARLAVIAYTGLPHALLKQLTPEMIDWDAKVVHVPARKKGKGVKSRRLPLSDAGVQALRRFDALDCYGTFSNSSMRACWRRACTAAKVHPIPRPYDLRHSFATEILMVTGDEKAAAHLLMHAESSRITHRYLKGGVAPRALVAVEALNRARGKQKKLAVSAGSPTERKQAKRQVS